MDLHKGLGNTNSLFSQNCVILFIWIIDQHFLHNFVVNFNNYIIFKYKDDM